MAHSCLEGLVSFSVRIETYCLKYRFFGFLLLFTIHCLTSRVILDSSEEILLDPTIRSGYPVTVTLKIEKICFSPKVGVNSALLAKV